MKSKILRKLCVYAVSASMMLPAAVPVAAAKAPVVSQVKDPFVLHGLNYITASSYNQVFFIENSRFFNLSYLSE